MGISGNLKTMQLAELLQWLEQGSKTGTLLVDDHRVQKRIFFQGGRIISSASTDPKEYLGHFLVSHGFIDEHQLAEAVKRQERDRSMLGKILVDMEALTHEQLDYMLRMKAEEAIYSLFGWKEADFRFLDNELPPYEMVPISLDVTGLVLEAMRRQDEWQRIQVAIPSMQCVAVRVVDDLAEDPKLDEGHRHILQALDDHRTIEEISLETHASEYYVCEAIYPQITKKRVKIVKPRGGAAAAAKASSESAIDLDHVSGSVLLERGMKHLRAGEHEAALRYLQAARSLDPDNPMVRKTADDGERTIRDQLKREGIVPEAIPVLVVPVHELGRVRVSPKAGFLLSRIDGRYDIAAILKISPMQPLEALLVVRELLGAGVVQLRRK
jgi:hypothetical protein